MVALGDLRGLALPTKRGGAPNATRLSVVIDCPAHLEPLSTIIPSCQWGGTALITSYDKIIIIKKQMNYSHVTSIV